jgi:hypothetical protein
LIPEAIDRLHAQLSRPNILQCAMAAGTIPDGSSYAACFQRSRGPALSLSRIATFADARTGFAHDLTKLQRYGASTRASSSKLPPQG